MDLVVVAVQTQGVYGVKKVENGFMPLENKLIVQYGENKAIGSPLSS